MDLGDLVRYQDKSWSVTSYDRVARLMILHTSEGEKIELPREYDRIHSSELQIVTHPPTKWPMLTAPTRSGAGPFVQLMVPPPPGRGSERVLVPWVDWVPSDCAREGGSFFVSPEVGLLPGMLLIATHKNGALVRIVVPKTFGTVQQRKILANSRKPLEPAEKNRFTRLLGDDSE